MVPSILMCMLYITYHLYFLLLCPRIIPVGIQFTCHTLRFLSLWFIYLLVFIISRIFCAGSAASILYLKQCLPVTVVYAQGAVHNNLSRFLGLLLSRTLACMKT